jgi:hypothetical protein
MTVVLEEDIWAETSMKENTVKTQRADVTYKSQKHREGLEPPLFHSPHRELSLLH